jgi:hypothetical protein
MSVVWRGESHGVHPHMGADVKGRERLVEVMIDIREGKERVLVASSKSDEERASETDANKSLIGNTACLLFVVVCGP